MNAANKNKQLYFNGLNFVGLLLILIISGIFLAGRLGYLYLSDAQRFPIAKVALTASFEHVSHQQLEHILVRYLNSSFFSVSVNKLQDELKNINWIDKAFVGRAWPDKLVIKLIEKKPVAWWNDSLMTEGGTLFQQGPLHYNLDIPKLKGPLSEKLEVLHVYRKLSKMLLNYGLKATGLDLRDNQSWVLTLTNNTKIYLGKKNLSSRLLRFCKAYPSVFAQKAEQLVSIDLRYPRGMAVQWKQQMEQ